MAKTAGTADLEHAPTADSQDDTQLSESLLEGIPLWTNTCRRCDLSSAWFLDDAPHALGWGDHKHFVWAKAIYRFGSHAHEVAIWNHSRLWDGDPLPHTKTEHDECWEIIEEG